MSLIGKFYIPSVSTMTIKSKLDPRGGSRLLNGTDVIKRSVHWLSIRTVRPYEEYTKTNSLPPVTIVPVSFLMQVQNDNTSLEDLSRYRKLGYEHVEEEKVLLDSLLTLYRKR
ncbi:hypothetical protein FRC18_003451, partial [Serendipita sp. 400]